MKFNFDYTPRNWELGLGLYLPEWYDDFFTDTRTRLPAELSVLLGPWTASIKFGSKITIVGKDD